MSIKTFRSYGANFGINRLFLLTFGSYGAFHPLQRPLVLIVAGASKAIFIALVLSEGTRYLSHQAGVAVAIDSVMVILFAWYLIAARAAAPTGTRPTHLSV